MATNKDLQHIVRELAEIYDAESKNTFISAYINTRQDKEYIKKRANTCESLLDGDEAENFSHTISRIYDFLDKTKEQTLAIFASEKHDFFRYLPLPMEISNLFIVDSSPYIRPLARIIDEWETFTLVLLDSHQAKIFSVSLGVEEIQENLSSDIMNKHKKGGWSQARFQRRRKEAIHRFFTELSEQLQKVADKQIIIAGPGTPKTRFIEVLPKRLRERIVDVIDVDFHDEEDLIQTSIDRISSEEDKRSHQSVNDLKKEIFKSGLAVYGMEDTLKAIKMGQVDVLIVEKDYKLKGCLCEHCQVLKAGPIKDCPVCGGPVTEADMIEEIIEFAERTHATIEFSDDEELAKLGHVGGLLRFKL